MTQEIGRQIPFGDLGLELVTDLDTGKQTLRRKSVRKSVERQAKTPAPTRMWWERMGFMAFSSAAEGWRKMESAVLAETFGHNMEFSGAQGSSTEAEALLKRAFGTAKRLGITSANVTEMMRKESLNIEKKLGATGASWVPAFVDSAIDVLAQVYGLNASSTEGLKRVAHQRKMPV